MNLCEEFHTIVPICVIHVFYFLRPNSPHYKAFVRMQSHSRKGCLMRLQDHMEMESILREIHWLEHSVLSCKMD